MRLILTASECIDKGIWDEVCKLKGFNVWAVNEGRMNSDEEISFNKKEMVTLFGNTIRIKYDSNSND